MERDALLAHGLAFTLKDRLMDCSDSSTGYICTKCGSLISTYKEIPGFMKFQNNNLFS